jgi:DNA-binding response OmpR family regulator
VLQASDGEEALALAREHGPDLVVLDVRMPKLDGYEVAQRLRTSTETARVLILILTASGTDHDVVRSFASGADDYMRKPFSPEELRVRVTTLLGRPV